MGGEVCRAGPGDWGVQVHPEAGRSRDPDSGGPVSAWGVRKGWAWGRRGRGTFLDELAPALGPVGELLRIRLLDLGALLHAVHQVVAQPVPVIDALHRPLVVPHLAAEQRARLPRAPRLARPAALATLSCRGRPPGHPALTPWGLWTLSLMETWTPPSHPTVYTLPHPTLNRISSLPPSAEGYL